MNPQRSVPPFQLVVSLGEDDPGKTYVYTKLQIYIGRARNNDVVVRSAEVSRRQARIYFRGGNFYLEDLGSTNGTCVNNRKINKPYAIQSGDVFSFGVETRLTFTRVGEQAQPGKAVEDKSAPVETGSLFDRLAREKSDSFAEDSKETDKPLDVPEEKQALEKEEPAAGRPPASEEFVEPEPEPEPEDETDQGLPRSVLVIGLVAIVTLCCVVFGIVLSSQILGGEKSISEALGLQKSPTPTPTEVPTRINTLVPTLAIMVETTVETLPLASETPFDAGTPTPSPTPAPPTAEENSDSLVSEQDGMLLLHIPTGSFVMGADDGNNDETPLHAVMLDEYWIDLTEVNNTQYALCVESGACQPPRETFSNTHGDYYLDPTFKDYPVIWVSWAQADNYCAWAGRRLPTEAEWEKAARGLHGSTFPWGEVSPNENTANFDNNVSDTTDVLSYETGASYYGVLNMAGNVWEWVADWYQVDYYQDSPSSNPEGPVSGEERVVRGGSWSTDEWFLRTTVRNSDDPELALDSRGFRCAYSP